MDKSSFCVRLKEERKRLKLSQGVCADLCDVQRETWSRYENGLIAPGMEVLAAIAAAGADVQYILTGIRSTAVVALTPREAALLDNYRNFPGEEAKRSFENMALTVAEAAKDETERRTAAKKIHKK